MAAACTIVPTVIIREHSTDNSVLPSPRSAASVCGKRARFSGEFVQSEDSNRLYRSKSECMGLEAKPRLHLSPSVQALRNVSNQPQQQGLRGSPKAPVGLGMERSFSYDLSQSLKLAASAAVVEVTGAIHVPPPLAAEPSTSVEAQLTSWSPFPEAGGPANGFRSITDGENLPPLPQLNRTASAQLRILDLASSSGPLDDPAGGPGPLPQSPVRSSSLRRSHSAFPSATDVFASGSPMARQPTGGLPSELPAGCPPHGAKAICGRRSRMEDAYTIVPSLLEVPMQAAPAVLGEVLPQRIASLVRDSSAAGSPSVSAFRSAGSEALSEAPSTSSLGFGGFGGGAASQLTSAGADVPMQSAEPVLEGLHFFGVFDGHGGAEAALHCAQTLHQRVAESLSAAASGAVLPPVGTAAAAAAESPSTSGPSTPAAHDSGGLKGGAPHAQSQTPVPESTPPSLPDPPGTPEERAAVGLVEDNGACSAGQIEAALHDAFFRTDEDFGKAGSAALVGTTAVVALVGERQLYVANCGDSRAVLYRGGVAIPLSEDHKAAREDETARVEAAGGQILFWNGVRVMGVLAVSRAIGDHYLRPFVIAQPEVTILGRKTEDELLLLASDGLWDVMSNEEACNLAMRCLRRVSQRGATRQAAARVAAAVLTKAAVDRGSRDNVTVVVVDLSSGTDAGANPLTRMQSVSAEAFSLAQEG